MVDDGDLHERLLVGLDATHAVTALLQRARSMHPTEGLFEAADVQWWWAQRERWTDEVGQLVWFDSSGQPSAAVVVTAGPSDVQVDPMLLPGAPAELWRRVVRRGLAHAANLGIESVTLEVDMANTVLVDQLLRAGLTDEGEAAAEGWIERTAIPPVATLPDGYHLSSRSPPSGAGAPVGGVSAPGLGGCGAGAPVGGVSAPGRGGCGAGTPVGGVSAPGLGGCGAGAPVGGVSAPGPHHMIHERRGYSDPEPRLRQLSLYRPDLDLVVHDGDGDVGAYVLCWFDPVTATGLVEPVRTEDAHQGRGLARAVISAGLERLVAAGAERVKICWAVDNATTIYLYPSIGFVPFRTTHTFAGPTTGAR